MSYLYTIVPPEQIFGDTGGRRSALWRHRGRLLYVEEDQMGSGHVVQLLSTDPRDFLDPAFSPGRKIWPLEDTVRVDGTFESVHDIPHSGGSTN